MALVSHYSRKLLIGFAGIYTSYLSISYLAEKLFNTKFKQGDKFEYPSLVTWVGCLLCSLYGLANAHLKDRRPNRLPLKERVLLGTLFTLNYLPTNYALLYISYPLQVVAKNTRYLLVIIVGIFCSRVKKSKSLKLPPSKLLIGIVISVGAALFMFYETNKEAKQFELDPAKRWIGYVLILIAVIADAFFSDAQAYCKENFAPTPNQLFLASNLYGFVLIFMFALVSGEMAPSIAFCLLNPKAFLFVLLIGALQVFGQISVYYVIANFKQHIYPLISTTRKIVTILVSILAFSHRLNVAQWLSLALVFAGMGFELYDEVSSQEKHRAARRRKRDRDREQGDEFDSQERSKANSMSDNQLSIISSKDGIDQKEPITLQIQKISSVFSRPAPNQASRTNRFIEKKPAEAGSLEDYRYNWRVQEVIDGRETSITPLKKLG